MNKKGEVEIGIMLMLAIVTAVFITGITITEVLSNISKARIAEAQAKVQIAQIQASNQVNVVTNSVK